MKTYIIEYEIPPTRAIHTVEGEFESEESARQAFADEVAKDPDSPPHHIRRVYEKGTPEAARPATELCKPRVGDSGQRYMVVADFNGVEKPVGYTSDPTGGSLMEGAKKWPACKNPRVVDRGLK